MANYQYITPLGLVVPDTATLLADVEAEYRLATGAPDLVTSPETPQGALIAAEVENRDAMVRNNVDLANQINPDIAGGIFLDAIWSLTRGKRRPAVRSVITGVVLGGRASTIIPQYSLASVQDTGATFRTKTAVILDDAGQATVDMESVLFGPIAAPANQLVNLATSVLGWETVNNPTAAALGAVEESDAAARRRRLQTLALQSVALIEAIISWLNDIDSVQSVTVRENVTNVSTVIDGVTLKPHSIYVCVNGGTDSEVAEVLLRVKSLGCGWNGAELISVVEPFSGQSYTVQFDRAVEVPVFAKVTARFNGLDGQSIIRDAIMQYANGELEGDAGFVVGGSVSPFELSGAINQVEPRIFVTKVELSTDGINYAAMDIPISIQQVATITEASITVVPA
jgi:uncharacterized phage protein gp47/JayE